MEIIMEEPAPDFSVPTKELQSEENANPSIPENQDQIISNTDEDQPQESDKEQKQSSPNDQKMILVMRQLYNDKKRLQGEVQQEIKSHKEDVDRLSEEINLVNAQIQNLSEKQNSPQPSPIEDQKIQDLTKQLKDLKTKYKSLKIEISDFNMKNSVIQKEVDQYKTVVSTLEEDLLTAQENKDQCNVLHSKYSNLEEQYREKQRIFEELLVSERLSKIKLDNAKNKITEIETQRPLFLSIDQQDDIYINQPVSPLPFAVQTIYKELNQNNLTKDDINQEKMNEFLKSLPQRLRILDEEHESIQEQCNEFRKKIEKIKNSKRSESSQENLLTDDSSKIDDQQESQRLAEIAKKLSIEHHQKSLKLKELKQIADNRHNTLQRLLGVPQENESLVSSLKSILKQLENCDDSDCKNLCDIGERLLDAMIGIDQA